MLITFDRASRAVTVVYPTLKTTSREPLQIRLLSNGQPAVLAAGETVRLEIKEKGITDDVVLIAKTLSGSDRNTDLALYEGTVDAYIGPVLTLLGIGDNNRANDASVPLDVDGFLLIYTPDIEDPFESDTFPLKLVASKHLPTDGTPLSLPTPEDWLAERLPVVGGSVQTVAWPDSESNQAEVTFAAPAAIPDGFSGWAYSYNVVNPTADAAFGLTLVSDTDTAAVIILGGIPGTATVLIRRIAHLLA